MKNGLYIVATPIGNMGDVSARAIETLKKTDFIICENPKHSLKLLSKFDIKKKLIALYDHNEQNIIEDIKEKLNNKVFSLISDAGSPLISDPGYKLVRFCIQNNIYVTVVPGASSITSALQISSIPIDKYAFYGFLPKSKNSIIEFVDLIKKTNITSVFFVSSHKILLLLEIMSSKLEKRKMAICKEITKINERVFVGFPEEVSKTFKKNKKNCLGEFVIVIEGNKSLKQKNISINPIIEDIIKKLLRKFSLTDTVKIVHKIGNIEKKEVYKKALELQNEK